MILGKLKHSPIYILSWKKSTQIFIEIITVFMNLFWFVNWFLCMLLYFNTIVPWIIFLEQGCFVLIKLSAECSFLFYFPYHVINFVFLWIYYHVHQVLSYPQTTQFWNPQMTNLILGYMLYFLLLKLLEFRLLFALWAIRKAHYKSSW